MSDEDEVEVEAEDEEASGLDRLGIIYLGRGINESSAEKVCKRIIEMNHDSRLDHIQLIINSPGGEVPSGFAIIDVMEWSRLPIHTTGLGIIASMGLLIFMAGSKGHRIVTSRTEIMSHRFANSSSGKHNELIAIRKAEDMMHRRFIEHYKRYSNLKSKKALEKFLLGETDAYLSPEEAKKLGLVDKIIRR